MTNVLISLLARDTLTIEEQLGVSVAGLLEAVLLDAREARPESVGLLVYGRAEWGEFASHAIGSDREPDVARPADLTFLRERGALPGPGSEASASPSNSTGGQAQSDTP